MSVFVTIEPFVSGGLAACLASTCIHPIDLAKVRLQVSKVQLFHVICFDYLRSFSLQ